MRHAICFLAGAAALACTEPVRKAPELAAAPAVVRLQASDTKPIVGSTVTLSIQLSGSSAPRIGSFTASIQYDSLSLRYADDVALTDSATRAVNPMAGQLRVAGVSPSGLSAGTLYSAKFTVLRPNALSTVVLEMTEMHTTALETAHVSTMARLP